MGLPEVLTAETSGLALILSRLKSKAKHESVPWSPPSQGITEDLGVSTHGLSV